MKGKAPGLGFDRLSSHKIMKMDEEKRARVINAAMAEFNKGYERASTDTIVREAGISKGLLFHYFESKENLYEFIVSYAFDVIISEYFERVDFGERDFLKRLWQMLNLKMDLTFKFPAVFDFITTAYRESKSSTMKEIYGYVFAELAPRAFADIDETLFIDGIDPKKAVSAIYYLYLGYSTTQLERLDSSDLEDFQKQYNVYLEELKTYFDIIRKTFYK